MTPEQMQKFLAENAVYERPKFRPIKSRHYNLVVREDDKIVEEIEYLSSREAKSLKAEYNAEGYKVDKIEDVTILDNEKELIFHPREEIPEIKGVGGFGTPSASPKKIEADRNKARTRAAKRNHKANGKTVRFTNSYSDPRSPLYPLYVAELKKKGFTVRDTTSGMVLFTGFMKETAAFVYNLITKGHYQRAWLDIKPFGSK